MPLRAVARCVVLLAFLGACRAPSPEHTAVDDLGRTVALPAEVLRVVTLAPSVTEIVFAIGAGQKIVATDDASNYPDGVRRLPNVGGMQPNIEMIAALRPDLVIASTEGNHPNLAGALDAAGIPLYVIRTDRLDQIGGAMQRLGTVLGGSRTEEAVRELVSAVEKERRRRERRPRVLFAVWHDPLYVAGRDTFANDLIALTGAENTVRLTGWPQYSLESLAAEPPELILFPEGAVSSAQIRELVRRVPGLEPRIVPVDEDVFQRPGPRVGEAARALNAILDELE